MRWVESAARARSDSSGENVLASASSGEGSCPSRPVRIWTMLIADEPESHRASSIVGAQIVETATITCGSLRRIDARKFARYIASASSTNFGAKWYAKEKGSPRRPASWALNVEEPSNQTSGRYPLPGFA